MARPVSFNINQKPLVKDISVANMPEGYQGEGFFAAKLSDVVGLARKIAICHLLLRHRIYGYHGFAL